MHTVKASRRVAKPSCRHSFTVSLFLIWILLCIASCKRQEITGPPEQTAITSLGGRVVNWSLGDSMNLRAYCGVNPPVVLGPSRVTGDGRFSVALPFPPAQTLGGFGNDNMNLSDHAAKFTGFTALIPVYPNGTVFIGRVDNLSRPLVYYAGDSVHIGDFWTYFEYADRDVEATGVTTTISPTTTVATYYNLTFNRGWNRIVSKAVSIDRQGVISEQRTVQNASEGDWYLTSYQAARTGSGPRSGLAREPGTGHRQHP